jgi:hypothetical protein
MMDPEGVPLTLALYEEIEPRLQVLRGAYGRNTLSEYAFSNLYLFRQAHAYRYLPGAYPCVAGITYDGARHLLPLFDLRDAPVGVLVDMLQGYDCFFPIPAEVISGLDATRLRWTDSADDADYLYPATNFRDYRGDVLRKKYNLMQQLLSAYRMEAQPWAEMRIADAMTILAHWMEDKQKQPGEADDLACKEALQLAQRFGLDGFVYYAGEMPVGFLLTQRIAPSVSVMRFAKGIDSHKGIYQYMFHHYCMSRSQDVEWLNFEQDLGLANFRQTKRSYQPSAMLGKYRVHLRR